MSIKAIAVSVCIFTGWFAQPLHAQTVNRGVYASVGYEFTYQGQLDDAGSPANGLYDMQFVVFTSTGEQIGSAYLVTGVSVVDGVFTVEIDFESDLWVDTGPLQKFLEVRVRPAGGGAYTTLSPRTKLTATPHANIARRLVFPYSDIGFGTNFLEPTFELIRGTDGSVAQFRQSADSDRPVALVQGQTIYNYEHGDSNGALQVDAPDERVGILAYGDAISVVGVLRAGTNKIPGDRSAVVGVVGFDADPNYSAMSAQNIASGSFALLARGQLAGEFFGDVLTHDSIRVRKEFLEDYRAPLGISEPFRAAPIAYGVVSGANMTNETSNISSQWDAANSRYVITVLGVDASSRYRTVIVTPSSSTIPLTATYDVSGSDYIVTIWELLTNTKTIANFSIMIYDATPTSTVNIPTAASAIVNDDALLPGVVRVPAGTK